MGVAAFALVIAITSGAGPGLDPDSMSYVGAATSLATHGELRVPSSSWDDDDSTAALTTWPPGFSAVMAVPQRLSAKPLTSARIILAVAAFITAAVLFLLLESTAGTIAGLAGVVAVFVTPAIVEVHLSVLSEPLFLACLVLTLLAMLHRPRRPLVAGIPAAAAVMVRYAGVCAPAAVVLWFFFSERKPLRQRFLDAAQTAVVPVIALGAWVLRSARLPNGQGGVELAVYGKLGPTLREGLGTIADWLVPGVESTTVRVALAVVMCVAIAFVAVKARSRLQLERLNGDRSLDGATPHNSVNSHDAPDSHAPDSRRREFLRADVLLLGCYLAVLLSARTFVGDAIPFDFRLLAPAILLAEAAIVVLVAAYVSAATRPARLAIGVVALLWLVGSVTVSSSTALEAIRDGSDFSASDWRDSPTLEWVRTHGAGWTLFTNWPAAVYFSTGRTTHDIPQSLDTADLREFGEILRERHGAFVAFDSYNTDYPPTDSIAHAMRLVEAAHLQDGKIWVSPGTAAK